MRSLADSDSVFESACDYDEVYFIYVSVSLYMLYRTYLMTVWRKVKLLARYYNLYVLLNFVV